MNAQLTPKDWELISTYLDGQLSEKEKRQVQDLLVLRPELSEGLEELRHTRTVLRAAPRRRAPRNFTITPDMARSARPRFHWGWAPSFGLASAVATFLFVLSFFFRMAPATLMPMAAQAPAAIRSSATSAENPPIIIWNGNANSNLPQGAVGMGGGPPQGGAALNPQIPEATPGSATDNQSMPSIAAQPSEAPTGEAPTLEAQLASPPMTEKLAPVTQGPDSSGPILGIAPTEEQGKIMEAAPSALASAQAAAQSGFDWLWVQAGLGALAVLTALAGLALWWRSRH